jgi:hypothetical protein
MFVEKWAPFSTKTGYTIIMYPKIKTYRYPAPNGKWLLDVG